MKPKTKLQRQVADLYATLPKITEEQESWAFKNCFQHKGYRTKTNIIYCLDCGHQWKDDQPHLLTSIDGCTCPHCGTKLKVTTTRKRKDDQGAYYGIISTCKGFQVCRYFELKAYYKATEAPRLYCWEISQHWIAPNGKFEIIARNHTVSWYCDSWTGDMVIRPKYNVGKYEVNPYKTYPKRQIIPEIKRNGFWSGFHDITPSRLFRQLLTNPRAETLLKAKQTELLKYMQYEENAIYRLWPSIRICIRNNYIVKDASIWKDYLYSLKELGKDLLNAKYVCPENLKAEHDRFERKKQEKKLKDEIERRKKEIAEAEPKYVKSKGKYFGIKFSDCSLHIGVLKSVREFFEEGTTMHHCVFSGSYYSKPDSLILSAKVNGKSVETIEISLKDFTIIQSRGLQNKTTKYHDRIIELIEKNIGVIKMTSLGKSKKKNKVKLSA